MKILHIILSKKNSFRGNYKRKYSFPLQKNQETYLELRNGQNEDNKSTEVFFFLFFHDVSNLLWLFSNTSAC